MKKLIMTAAAVFAFGFANAQEVKFGAKAGLNLNMMSNSGAGSTKTGANFLIGGLAEIKFNEKMALQPELYFSQEGGKYSVTDTSIDITINTNQDIKVSKINIPVLFKYYVIDNLALEFGPEISYILKAKSTNYGDIDGTNKFTGEYDFNNTTLTLDQEGNIMTSTLDSKLNKINFALNLGASYNFDFGMFVDVRENFGLTKYAQNANFLNAVNKYNDPILDGYKDMSLKNSNLQITVGYRF